MWLLIACTAETPKDELADTAACEPSVFHLDADGDGVGGDESLSACTAPTGYVSETGDCDDDDPEVHPSASELCNGIDDDCDTVVDDEPIDLGTWYVDGDGDGWGGEAVEACEQPSGTVEVSGDCDDTEAAVAPGTDETCNDVDDDCDGTVDEDPTDPIDWWPDEDGDGYGAGDAVQACDAPSGYSGNDQDCDDDDASEALSCTNAPVAAVPTCEGMAWLWSADAPEDPELHVIGVYEPAEGTVTVTLDRPTESVLALSAYEPVDWVVEITEGTTLSEIIVSGYEEQTVTGPDEVPITLRTYAQTGSYFGSSCGYSLPYTGGGCDTDALIATLEGHTGLELSSFSGCYTGAGFTLR